MQLSNVPMVKFHEDAYWPDNLSLFTIIVSIAEGPKNKIMRVSGIHSAVPCRDSTLEQFWLMAEPRQTLPHPPDLDPIYQVKKWPHGGSSQSVALAN